MCQAFGQRSIRAITKLIYKITFLIENAKTFIQFFVYKVMQFTFTKLLSNSLPYGTTLYLNNLFLIINYTSY